MTEKEKAKELVEKFMNVEYNNDKYIRHSEAKQCALITVDEINKFLNIVQDDVSDRVFVYWQRVKTEIEKL